MKFARRRIIVSSVFLFCLLIMCSLSTKTCDAKELPLMSDDSFEFSQNYREFVEKFPNVAQEAPIIDPHMPQYIRNANGDLYMELYTLDVGAKGKHATIQALDRTDGSPRVVVAVRITHYPTTDNKIWGAAILGTLYAIGVEPEAMNEIARSIKPELGSMTRTYSPLHGGYIYTKVDRVAPNSDSFCIMILANDE